MMNRLKLSVAALGLSAALATGVSLPAMAQSIPMPAVGKPKAISVPAADTYQLANGITVTLIPYATVPKASIYVAVPVGNNDDGEHVWISDMTSSLMREGAGNLSGAQISEAFADMGGGLGTGVSRDVSSFQTSVLTERVPDAIATLATIIRQPTFPEGPLERVRQGMIRNVAVGKSQASGQLSEAFFATVYEGHPYEDVYPTPEQLQSYTIDQLKAFYAEHFGPRGVRVYVAGQYDPAAVKQAIENAFGDWQGNNQPAEVAAPPRIARRVVLVNRPGAVQSTLRLAFDVPTLSSPDAIKYELMDSLLGGAFNSRITRNIREDKGYAYSPGSSIDNVDRNTSHWVYDADVTAANTGDSLREIFSEIRKFQSEAPTAAEAEGSQNYNAGLYVLGLATPSGVLNKTVWVDQWGLPRDYIERYVPEVMSVSATDMQRAAQGLDFNKMTLVVVGDLETVRPQLEALPELQGVTFEVFQP